MFVAPRRTSKKITLQDDFASLISIGETGDLEFEVTYRINQTDIIRSGVTKVNVSAYVTRKREFSIFENKHGFRADTGEMIQNILNLPRAYRGVVKANENFVLTSTLSDASAFVNNQLVSYVRSPAFVRSGNNLDRYTQAYRTRVSVKPVSQFEDDEGDVAPIIQTNRNNLPDIDFKTTVRQSMKSVMLKKGIDPGRVVDLSRDRTSASKNSKGVYVPPTRRTGYRWGDDENADIVRQTFTQMIPGTTVKVTTSRELTSEKLIPVIDTVPRDQIDIPVRLLLEASKLSTSKGVISKVFVKLDALNKCGMIVDSIEKELDIAFHLRLFSTPKIAPEVKFSRYESLSKGTLQIFQMDPLATSVRVYRKFVSHITSELDDYVLVGQFSVAKGKGFATVPIDISRKDTSVYRIIPVSSEGLVGFEFTNLIINPSGGNKIKFRHVSLSSRIVENGVSLEVRELPADAVAFRILRKNKTIFEKDVTTVGDVATYVDRSKDEQVYSIVDNQTKDGNTYEYVVELIYQNGTTDLSGNVLVEYLPLVENLVDTRIVDLQTSADPIKPDVSFRIESKLTDSNLDAVKSLLERQGLSQFFTGDVQQEREKLKSLIAHQVTRVNLTTGQRENFGVVTTAQFTDSELGKINSVLPLKQGYRYRYEVNTLLRAPETLFENLEKSAIDPFTKKAYTFKPSKFLHPITMKKGNILERSAQLTRYAKDDMSFGNVGDLVATEVAFTQERVVITDVKAFKYDRYHVLLQWTLGGSSKLVENFIIVLEENGMQVPIGKAHAIEQKRQYEFIHSLPIGDVGNYVYKIIPIFSNYSMGPESKSNAVLVV